MRTSTTILICLLLAFCMRSKTAHGQRPFGKAILAIEYGSNLQVASGLPGPVQSSLHVFAAHLLTNINKYHYVGLKIANNRHQDYFIDTSGWALSIEHLFRWAMSERSSLMLCTSLDRATMAELRIPQNFTYGKRYFLGFRPMLSVNPLQHYGRLGMAVGIQFAAPIGHSYRDIQWMNYGVLTIHYQFGDRDGE
jgi:hypothetical protein